MTTIIKFATRIEMAIHYANAYLARHRGDISAVIDSLAAAHKCERKLDVISS